MKDCHLALTPLIAALSIFLHGCATSPKAAIKIEKDERVSPVVLAALSRLGHLEGDPQKNTFFIPKKPNAGDCSVIYWKEKNVLFVYPTLGVTCEITEQPHLVRGTEYKIEATAFRRSGDPDYASSTYLQTYDWAFARLIDALVNGRKYELIYKRKSSRE